MSYKIKGNTVVKRDTGKIVGHSANPKRYLRTLEAIEHGWKPTGKKKKLKFSKRTKAERHHSGWF